MKKFIMLVALVFGMVGVANALPVYNDGSELDGHGELYGTYMNSGDLLFMADGNNTGNNLEDVELLVEGALGLDTDFELIETEVFWTFGNMGTTGTWESETNTLSFYAVKAGNGYAMYSVNPADNSGSWSTFDLWEAGYNKGVDLEISHFTAYNPNPVPEPCTMLLLGTGIAGLGIWKRKKNC